MDAKKIKEHLKTLSYGPASESAEPALHWLKKHNSRFGHFINGKEIFSVSGHFLQTHNPANEEKLADFSFGSVEDVDLAMNAAHAAYPSWQSLTGERRVRYLYNIARTMEKYARVAQVLESLDNGKPFRESRDVDIPLAVRHFRYHAGWALTHERDYHSHKAPGVVAQIIPWNFPLLMLAWKIAPAIAVGNTVVLKPAEFTPLTALWFADIIKEVGIPEGVVNIVTGDGSTGQAIVRHPIPWKIMFTGSTEVGRSIREATADSPKELSLELGGKSAFIVFSDADLDSAVEGLVNSIWFNYGQVCCAGSRLLVEESVEKILIDKIRRRMNMLRGIMPGISQLDKAIDFGAINSRQQFEKIKQMCSANVNERMEIYRPRFWHYDGPNNRHEGYFFPPTMITNISPSSVLMQEEIFGPVVVVMSFRTPQEAVELANNTRYGLAASVWTEDLEKAQEVARNLVAGTVWVNDTNKFDAASGFGGYRESGFGREGGREGILEFLKEDCPKSLYYTMTDCDGAHPLRNDDNEKKNDRVTKENLCELDATYRFLIGGKLARPDGQNSFVIQNKNDAVLGVFADANRKDERDAVRAARNAAILWREAGVDLRAKILYFIAENLEKNRGYFENLLVRSGAGSNFVAREVDTSIRRLLLYAGLSDKFEGAVQSAPYHGTVAAMKEPRGVIVVRAPDEFPLLGFISVFAPAYVTGNAIVMIAGKNPLLAFELLQTLQHSETPAGTVNLLSSLNPNEGAIRLASHKDVDAIWYFGNASGSAAVKKASVSNMKYVLSNHGALIDWFGLEGESEKFLRAAVNIKNIWIPSHY